MRRIILISLIVLLSGGLIWLILTGKNNIENKNAKVSLAFINFEKTNNYLQKFKGNYPIPSGDIILLNKKGEEIHLEDRNIPLNKIKDLYAIQGTTCNILKNDKKFNSFNYDPRYSIIKDNKADGKILFKKCFSYSVTKDRKYYQIGTVERNGLNFKAKLAGNTKKSLTRAYDSSVLVKNNNSEFLPYAPEKLSPVVKVKNLSSSKIYAQVKDMEGNEYKFKLKEGVNKLLSGNLNQKFQIKISGNLSKDTNLEFIDTNGSIVYLKPTSSGNLSFKLHDYQIDTKRIDYIVEAGKFLASIVKLSPDKNMTVSNRGTTLVIRGTKFSIEATKDEFSTFLVLGKIVQKLSNGKNIELTRLASASVIIGTKLVENVKKIKKLISYVVYNDIKTMPRYSYNIKGSLALTGIIDSNLLSIKYSNGENISILSIPISKFSYYRKKNKIMNFKKKGGILSQCNSTNIDISKIKNYLSNCNKDKYCDSLKKKYDKFCKDKSDNSCLINQYNSLCSKSDLELYYSNLVNNICKIKGLGKGLDVSKLYYILDNKTGDLKNGFILKDNLKNKIKGNYVLLTSRYGGVNGSINFTTRVGFKGAEGSILNIPLPSLINNKDIDKIIIACEK